ncbi:neutral and basic amino acid transport protein rBAT-like [Mizuhopecten yessoensis]|uniref:Neutral and basic amino acid transport protein rBAT n=1 Tax=Mizuhopecten yessoensis TaxID=6573 RepID=A0A210Q431_MIZYE|nr:neutral and basic amino acid transport protein rBAT-like [Mizuhopecten yessoensis]OWF43493.1 Neutral and basic amino acid transport protein rBAT [Mizuhopecten yessoensis]
MFNNTGVYRLSSAPNMEATELEVVPEFYKEEENNPFYGMNKKELLEVSSQPCWRRLRAAFIGLVILAWLALLVAVVALVLMYPKCKAAEERSWWQNDVVYRIYVRSFQDSDGDGIGDLTGVEQQLDYIQALGANTISLSPVFETDGTDDFGVTDSLRVHPDLGSMLNLTALITKVKDKGMRILLDFIPNQTSKNHSWFTASAASSAHTNDYRNYYVWSDYTNNWRTVSGDVAWTFHFARNETYLHQFSTSQPDLNLRSGRVQDELKTVLEFWLRKGVDGFYVRNSAYLFEDYDLRNEGSNGGGSTNDYENLVHNYTLALPGVFDMLSRWRAVVSSNDSILIADMPSSDVTTTMAYYGHSGQDGVHLSLNRYFFDKAGSCNGACVKTYVDSWMSNLSEGRWASWMAGDENVDRFASRFNSSYIRAYYMLTMLLPGTPILYYGDEILLKNNPGIANSGNNRTMRGLMQWRNATDGGFCSASTCSTPWISPNADASTNNVQSQDANADSMLQYIRSLTKLRQQTSFRVGTYHPALVDDNIFSYVREFNGEMGYLVAINFGTTSQTRSYYGYASVEKDAEVAMTSGPDVGLEVESEVTTDSITLGPKQGVVLSWDFVAKEEL